MDDINEMHSSGLANRRNRCLAKIHSTSALSFGLYGFWIASGWPSHIGDELLDGEMREHGRCCWRWSLVCVLLIPCLLGAVGGFILALSVLVTALLPRDSIGVLITIYEITVGDVYLLVFLGYSRCAYRRILAGESFAYPMAKFRIF